MREYPYNLTITKNDKVIENSTYYFQFKLKERINNVVMEKNLSKLGKTEMIIIKIERKYEEELF